MVSIRNNRNSFKGKYTEKFSTQVLQCLKTSMKLLAYKLGISYSTYYNWHAGDIAFPPDLIPSLCKACEYDDDRLRTINFFLEPLDLMPIKTPQIVNDDDTGKIVSYHDIHWGTMLNLYRLAKDKKSVGQSKIVKVEVEPIVYEGMGACSEIMTFITKVKEEAKGRQGRR